MISDICNEDVNLSIGDILFRLRQHRFILPVYSIDTSNFIILVSQWEMWKHRNNIKMDHTHDFKICHLFEGIIDAYKLQINLLLHSRKC